MMKVTFRTSLGSRDAFQIGIEHEQCQVGCDAEVSDDAAKWLADRGIVELHGEAKPVEVKGVPKEPDEGTVEKATADLKTYKDKQSKKLKSDDK